MISPASRLPNEIRLSEYFERALDAQDDVFQFWVAEIEFVYVVDF